VNASNHRWTVVFYDSSWKYDKHLRNKGVDKPFSNVLVCVACGQHFNFLNPEHAEALKSCGLKYEKEEETERCTFYESCGGLRRRLQCL